MVATLTSPVEEKPFSNLKFMSPFSFLALNTKKKGIKKSEVQIQDWEDANERCRKLEKRKSKD